MPGQCRGIQGNTKGTYGSVCKLSGDAENTEECQGNAGEYREMPGVRMGVGAKCKGMLWNAGEYQGNMGVGENCQRMQGYAGECQLNIWEWV